MKRATAVCCSAVSCSIVITILASGAIAATKYPTGYGTATFGMPYEQVRKLYPKAEVVDNDNKWGAPGLRTELQKRLALHKQSVLDLPKPVDVELRFWKDKLWVVIVYFGENEPKKVVEALTKAYGPPTTDTPQYEITQWNNEKVLVTAEVKQRRYSMNDQEISKDSQEWFISELKKTGGLKMLPQGSAAPKAGAAQSPPSGSSGGPAAAKPAAPAAPPGGEQPPQGTKP